MSRIDRYGDAAERLRRYDMCGDELHDDGVRQLSWSNGGVYAAIGFLLCPGNDDGDLHGDGRIEQHGDVQLQCYRV